MNLVMNADCLIKLTKAGLKEAVCSAWSISIPRSVQRETVEQARQLPDAVRIGHNIKAGRISVLDAGRSSGKGEEAALRLYESGGFDAVATDDARFIRRLRGLGVPYAVPGVIVAKMCRQGVLPLSEAVQALAALRGHISAEQHAAAQLILSGGET